MTGVMAGRDGWPWKHRAPSDSLHKILKFPGDPERGLEGVVVSPKPLIPPLVNRWATRGVGAVIKSLKPSDCSSIRVALIPQPLLPKKTKGSQISPFPKPGTAPSPRRVNVTDDRDRRRTATRLPVSRRLPGPCQQPGSQRATLGPNATKATHCVITRQLATVQGDWISNN